MHSDKPEYCANCVEMQKATKQCFNCSACEFNSPHLLEGPKTAFKVYSLTSLQRRYHMGGLAGFDMPAVLSVAKDYGIKITRPLIDMLCRLEYLEMEGVRNKDGE